MSPEMLESLLKFAALGTSGICVLGVAWVGVLVSRLPPDAERTRHNTLRLYMILCLAIALVSTLSAWWSPSASRQQELEADIKDLTVQKQTLETEKSEIEKNNQELKTKIHEHEAKLDTIRTQVKTMTALARTQPTINNLLGGALRVIEEAVE